MLGPMPMDDINNHFPMVPPSDRGREANDMFAVERFRRQRTIRTLMMFLMMLILMEEEDSAHKDHQNKIHDGKEGSLRHGNNRQKYHPNSLHNNNNIDINDKLNSDQFNQYDTMDLDLFDTRRILDGRVSNVVKSQPAWDTLYELNNKSDESSKVDKWVQQELDKELLLDNKEVKNLHNSNNPESSPSRKKLFTWKKKEEEKINQQNSESLKMVYHYPRNFSGYFKGEWKRNHPIISTTAIKNNHTADTTTTKLVNDHEFVKYVIQEKQQYIGVQLVPQGKHIQSSPNIRNVTNKVSLIRGLDEDESSSSISSTEAQYIRKSSEYEFDYVQQFRKYMEKGKVLLQQKQQKKVQPPSLPLTRDEGRLTFQIYSKPIPAVHQLSLLDGYITLSDKTGLVFNTVRDIKIRVRGVIIHSIGKISMVSNDGYGRSGLVLVDEDKENNKLLDGKVENKIDTNKRQTKRKKIKDELTKKNITRKLLKKSLDKVTQQIQSQSSSPSSTLEKEKSNIILLENVRDKVVQIYSKSWKRNIVGGNGWTLERTLSSIEDEQENVADNKKNPVNGGVTNTRKLLQTQSKSSRGLKKLLDHDGEANDVFKIGNNGAKNETLLNEEELSKEKKVFEEKLRKQWWLEATKNTVFRYPYVPDDENLLLRKSFGDKNNHLSSSNKNAQDSMLIKNAAQCEFEINLNIAPIKWSVGEWRAMVKRQILDMYSLNITNKSSKYLEQQQSNNNHESNDYKYQKWFFNSTTHNTQDTKITTKAPLPHDEAFVIETTGTIISPNCDFSAAVNASAVRINWQRTSRKATNYSFYMMLICLTQIVLLMRQLLHSQPQSVAVRVSLICIGWQTVLDAMICIGHILLALSLQSMFSAFAMISFFKLLIFCVIEMKYMTIIIQARHNANDNILSNTNVHLQRKVTLLHIQFYCSLIFALMLLWYVGWYYRTLYALFLYSFWLPQIVLNVITEAKMPLHHSFVKGMSLTRLVAPFYFFTNSNNFAREISQEFETDLIMCFILLLWVVLQAAVLIGQGTYGARFMIPSR